MDILDIAIAKQLAGGGGGSGTDNYNDLSNLPKINDVTLSGNKSSSALGLQSEITSENKLDSDLIDDTDQDNKFVTSSEKNIWNAKQNAIDADHKLNADYVDDSTSTNKFVTASDKETWNAKQNAIDNSHKLSSDLVDDTNHTNKFVTSTEKQTWNAKQNAIDADHKLSSSLVNFSDAEAAAIASGIDSSKVAQISTNQSNILYGLQTGVKNLFDLKNADITAVTNISIVKTDTSLTVTTTGEKKWSHVSIPMELEAGTYHVLATISNRTADASAITRFIVASGAGGTPELGGVTFTNNGTIDFQFTTTGGTVYLIPYPNYSGTGYNATFTASDIMVCTKAAWDQEPNVFRPYALPNYDLTRLEAEDRAGLVECVDGGAKNLVDWRNTVSFQNVTIDNGTYTTSGDSLTTLRFQVAAIDSNGGQIMAFNGNGTIPTANGVINIPFIVPSGTAKIRAGHNGSTYNGRFDIPLSGTTLEVGKSYVLQVNVTQYTNSSGIFKWKDLMVATKAAFGVSKAFVPYRPNYDLVVRRAGSTATVPYTSIAAETWERVSDLSFDVLSGETVCITAGAVPNNTNVTGIQIVYGSTANTNIIAINDSSTTTGMLSLNVTGVFKNRNSYNGIVSVFVKYAAANKENYVTIDYSRK